jgi:hypothetical protein
MGTPVTPLPDGNKIPGKPTGIKFPKAGRHPAVMIPSAMGLVWLGWTGMHMWAAADKINPPPVKATAAEEKVSSCFVDTLNMPRVGVTETNTTDTEQVYVFTVEFLDAKGHKYSEATEFSTVMVPGEQKIVAGTGDLYATSKKVTCKITYASRTQQ